MTWGRRVLVGAMVLALCAVWAAGLAGAAGASSRTFVVDYIGQGHFTSKNESIVNCGTETRDEDTHFSWYDSYGLHVSFGPNSYAAATDGTYPITFSTDDNSSTVDVSGCAGQANCQGESTPAPEKATAKMTGAVEGHRSRFTVRAVASQDSALDAFEGKDFTGTFSSGGSCASYIRATGLLTEELNVSDQLLAKFPVKYTTLRSLRKGHHFAVHIYPGHYAPVHHDFCQPSNGCLSEKFSWTATVIVHRVK